MTGRKLTGTIFFIIFFMILGRNLSFLPEIGKVTSSKAENTEELKTQIEDFVKGRKGQYAVYYKSYNLDSSLAINDKQIYTAASVNKVPLIAALYHLSEKGKLSLDEKITIQQKDLQDYGTGSLRYTKPGDTYSLRNLARLALQQSDNTAAHVIRVRVDMKNVQQLVNAWGMSQTNMENNKTSLRDMEILFGKIYKREIASEAKTLELLEFLTDSSFEDRIPSKLPKDDAVVYHKTGDGIGFVHDVGIIEYNGNKFYLGVMTSDIGEEEAKTKEAIGEIAKIIFDNTIPNE